MDSVSYELEERTKLKIWKSHNSCDPNIYCTYEGIRALDPSECLPSAYALDYQPELIELIPFGLGLVKLNPDSPSQFVCEGDAIEWLYERCRLRDRTDRTESIEYALEALGVDFEVNAIGLRIQPVERLQPVEWVTK